MRGMRLSAGFGALLVLILVVTLLGISRIYAINRIAHILGLKTVAEFVEDATTLSRLRALGVDYAQGYFIAKPEALVKSAPLDHAVLESA